MPRGVPKTPEVPKDTTPAKVEQKPPEGGAATGTVRRGKKANAKKKEGDFNAEMAVLRLTSDAMDPASVRAAVLEAVNKHGEARVFEALRAVQMPEEFLAPAIPATTQDVAPVTSADNAMPSTQPAKEPATGPAAAATVAADSAANQALPKPGTFTVKDVLAGKVAVPEATTPAAAAPKADNAGQPSPAAQQAAVQAVQEPARTYQPTSQELLGQLEAAYGPGFPAFTPAESAVNPLIGLSDQGFAGGEFPVVQGQPGRVRLINPVLPPPIPRASSMEEIIRGLGMGEPSPDPGRLQLDIGEDPVMLPANAADGVGEFQVNPPRPGIKQMQESLQQPEVPAAPKQTIYEKLGMNPPADMGTSGAYKNIPTGLKATGILGLLGAGAYGIGRYMTSGQPQQEQPQVQGEDDFEKAKRILMTPMKFE